MDERFYSRLNQYRSLWVLVFFDLPTETRKERKIATSFRKKLLDDGFAMFQFSIYMRFCASRENAEVHVKRIRKNLPKKGKVGIMQITDRQFGLMEVFHGTKLAEKEQPVQQLELF
ncbi:CRISPR-associated endonuclease Cas2 [Litoribacter ruber]|uniref:CRISPR-associated endonuclease Cas2 n=1 Tax=Litoribacter ruber TaxID=702568 RepID=UPI001BDAFEAF|nr:CRISPR-associated endonuclease Cas2 [Litoribacter ruber]MBT0810088.1 CRISPR-associated endonuclease Cas2 [Litoribacter ruber]